MNRRSPPPFAPDARARHIPAASLARALFAMALTTGAALGFGCGQEAGSGGATAAGGSSVGPGAGTGATPVAGTGGSPRGSGGSPGGAGGSGGAGAPASGEGGAPLGAGGLRAAAGGRTAPAGGGGAAAGGRSGAGAAAGGAGARGGSAGAPSGGAAGAGNASATLPAFPGAVGFGRVAVGGRGNAVFHVTNLNDAGAGSFRDAVSQSNRVIVFDVGGYVVLATPISAKSNLTVAGQTAPGMGIGFMGREISFSGASNVIVRYVRFRQGDLDPDSTKSGINLLNTTRMIFDHVSIEFAQWNNIDAVGASDITIQHSIDANPIGQQFAAHTEKGPYTWYRNLFANAHNRCPLAKDDTQYVDNVVYNYQAGYTAGNTAGLFSHDLVHNYFVAGPSTTSGGNFFYQLNNQSVFIDGNFSDTDADGALNGAEASYPGSTVHLASPWSPDTRGLPTTSAADTWKSVLADAGDSRPRDDVDTQVVADAMSLGKAGHLWKSQTETGLANSGYGTLPAATTGAAAPDTDKDGMPDAWELKHGLDPSNPADATLDFDHTGYTNIEKYVNGLVDGLYP